MIQYKLEFKNDRIVSCSKSARPSVIGFCKIFTSNNEFTQLNLLSSDIKMAQQQNKLMLHKYSINNYFNITNVPIILTSFSPVGHQMY
jgi:hypothetical protein